MLADNCNTDSQPVTHPHQWGLDELEARAGALVNEALSNWPDAIKQVHWQDMKQTAMLTLLEHQDQAVAYAYLAAQSALKNYKWVHIRGLNGGWKSLACHQLEVLDEPLTIEGDSFDAPRDNLFWRLPASERDVIPRPVEWQVIRHLDQVRPLTTAAISREILIILAGMSTSNWYPEQIYRAALIMAMLMTGYTWADVETQMVLDYSQVWDIWWHYRKTRLTPYLKLTPIHQELVKLRGSFRLCYYEELSTYWLNQAQRKMVVLPHGIYTITYKRRGRRHGQKEGCLEASLQKGVSVNGKPVVRAVSLGAVGQITRQRLLTSSHRLDRKMVQLGYRPAVMA
ncbi:MAG: hypothetical protein H6658_11495 [Ardenticatenaceae bacterium]|nr:hypothetical protein [Ardenticatenaceae bacterium]